MIGVVLFLYLVISVIFVLTWVGHNAGPQMMAVALSMLAPYVMCAWHSVRVKGARQTVAFFVLAAAISFFAEYMGSNHDWFFGQYDYTESLGPRIGGVPVLIILSWGVVVYSSYMLVECCWGCEASGATRRGSGKSPGVRWPRSPREWSPAPGT